MTCCEHEAELNRLKAKLAHRDWAENDRRKEAAYQRSLTVVYFIRCESYIKIGISRQPEKRLKQIRTLGSCVFPTGLDIAAAEIVATEQVGADAAKREKELHQQFAHLRVVGEWFTETPEITDYIKSVIRRRLLLGNPNAA